MTRISFGNEGTRDEDSASQRDAGDHTKDLELRVSEEWQDLWEVDIAREVP